MLKRCKIFNVVIPTFQQHPKMKRRLLMQPYRVKEPSEDDLRIKKMNQVFYFAVGAAILLIIYYLWNWKRIFVLFYLR